MKLDEWRNVVVGREVDGEGLPKDARKRLTIAIQLAIEPKILFLDEPTTGLSQTEARLVIDSVKRATDHYGLITLATIHQPSKQIWDAFDDVCLLVRGGRVAYMGECGENSRTVLAHFESMTGVTPPDGCNPADYCLNLLSSVDVKESEINFQKSEQSRELIGRIQYDIANSRETPKIDMTRANNPLAEIGLLTVRHVIVQWRNPSYCLMRIFSSMVMSLYVGILFMGDKSVLSGAVFSIGAIFFLVFVLVIPMQAAVVPLVEDRSVLYRETVSGTYSRLSYGIGQLLADQPFHLLNTVLMWVFFYFLVDFRRTGEEMGYFLLMLYLANWVIQSLGQLFALASPNEESANGLGGLSVILSVILMGFLITVSAMPSGWQWACKFVCIVVS
jgi:ABC-type multidrug transport system permease subunit